MVEVCPFSLNWILGENSADTLGFRIWGGGGNLVEYMYEQLFQHLQYKMSMCIVQIE